MFYLLFALAVVGTRLLILLAQAWAAAPEGFEDAQGFHLVHPDHES